MAVNKCPFIPQHLAVRSMRDSGYKNTAYALAELIDNSYQAIELVRKVDRSHKGLIELFVVETKETVEQRERWRITTIAVMDNGCGMDADTLQRALQFGNGSHLEDREGIGRFGMGLPNSTISQCKRADIWTWQKGVRSAICSYLDIDKIESQVEDEVPRPIRKVVPPEWIKLSEGVGDSGTLVVWSDLDRVNWRGARVTLEHTEFLIGRIYRKLIQKGLVIRLVAVRDGAVEYEQNTRANDPLYLMSPSNTPAPFGDKPMFQPWGKDGRQVFEVNFHRRKHRVEVNLTWGTDEARLADDNQDAGKKPYGQHAKKNVGISLVRAGRELILDDSWATRDLRERWWGAEISFSPGLDEVFGVTNNKQSATHFSEMVRYYHDERSDEEWSEVREAWKDENDPRFHLIEICNYVNTQLQSIRSRLRDQTKGRRSKTQQRHDVRIETAATRKFEERVEQGHGTKQDQLVPPNDTQKALEDDLVRDKNYPKKEAHLLAREVINDQLKLVFVQKNNGESTAFFSPDFLPGVTELVFNTTHPAYGKLIEMLDPDLEGESLSQLKQRIGNASDTLKMLLCAWARYEMEEKEGPRREKVKEVRREWGKMARLFLEDIDTIDIDGDDD